MMIILIVMVTPIMSSTLVFYKNSEFISDIG